MKTSHRGLSRRPSTPLLIVVAAAHTVVQVNASPSISADTKDDHKLKVGVLSDLLTIVDVEGKMTGTEAHVGGVDLVYMNGPIRHEAASEITTYLGAQNHHGVSLKKLEKWYGKLRTS